MIELIKPKNGKTYNLLTKRQMEYILKPNYEWQNEKTENEFWIKSKMTGDTNVLETPNKDYSLPLSIKFSFLPKVEGLITVYDKKGFKTIITAKNGKAKLFNLIPDTKYYFLIETKEEKSKEFFFFTSKIMPRFIFINGATNVRDIGGYKTSEGKSVKFNMVFRSSEFDNYFKITKTGIQRLKDLGIKTNFDIQRNIESNSSILTNYGIKYFHLPIEPYTKIFDLEMKNIYKQSFLAILKKDFCPFMIHCFAGMDRTGTWVLLLLAMLGVNEEDILIDYELSSFSVFRSRSRKSNYFTEFYNKLLEYGNNLNESATNYLLSCGLTKENLNDIKNLLLE